jgi:hypothetical protein
MPKIVLPVLPLNGQRLLDTKEFSNFNDSYPVSTYARLTSPDKDSGLMSSANGRLSSKNLHPNFELGPEHIQPEQASLARIGSVLDTSTIYGNGVAETVAETNYFTLPGCTVRWYQPFDTTVSLMQWSFFVSYNSWRGAYTDSEQEHHSNINTPIYLRCKLDDEVIDGTTRLLGQNMFHPLSPGAPERPTESGPGNGAEQYYRKKTTSELVASMAVGGSFDPLKRGDHSLYGGNPQYVESEAHTASHFDLHHMTNLSKGYHEIYLECSISLPEGASVFLQNKGSRKQGFVHGRGYFNLVGKLSLGIRNARVLNLL